MATAFPYKADVGDSSYLAIEAVIKRQPQFSGIRATSDYRPGSITISGNVSYHARKNAVDFVGSRAGMVALARWIQKNYGPYTLELIHSAEGGINVHNGVFPYKYGSAVTQEHYDHVHWAITNSGLAAGGSGTLGNGTFVGVTNTTQVSNPTKPKVGCALPGATMVAATAGIGWMSWETLLRMEPLWVAAMSALHLG